VFGGKKPLQFFGLRATDRFGERRKVRRKLGFGGNLPIARKNLLVFFWLFQENQWVALTHNPFVPGSSPGGPTKIPFFSAT